MMSEPDARCCRTRVLFILHPLKQKQSSTKTFPFHFTREWKTSERIVSEFVGRGKHAELQFAYTDKMNVPDAIFCFAFNASNVQMQKNAESSVGVCFDFFFLFLLLTQSSICAQRHAVSISHDASGLKSQYGGVCDSPVCSTLTPIARQTACCKVSPECFFL